jgi:hypothetical protein
MPFLATPQGIKLEFNGTQNGVPIVNVVHLRCVSGAPAGQLDTAIIAGIDFWNDQRVNVSNSYVLQNITATDISVANGAQIVQPITSDAQGAATGTAAAANAAVCISLRTAQTGRSFRGRFFVGGLPQAALETAQSISTGAAAAYATNMTTFIDTLETAGFALAVLSKYASGALRVAGLLTDIIAVIVDTKVDSQRRRTAN